MYCFNCGEKVSSTQKFCTKCGTSLEENKTQEEPVANSKGTYSSLQNQMKGTFMNATERMNNMVGEEGSIDVNLKTVFSSVFKKHTKEEGELLFISGTKTTTPNEKEISTSWPKPWLFSRVFLVLVLTFIFLLITTNVFQNIKALPGLIIIGSFAVPFSLLILFWEMNAPRNISIYEVAKMFFIGGTGSLVTTMILYSFLPVYDLSISSAIIIGVVEEIGKLAIIIYFIKILNPKFILNGLLIGATIGAGFAAFESAGYAFDFHSEYGDGVMMSVIYLRAWTSIGTHVVWSAIAGAALVYVKGDQDLTSDSILNPKFLRLFSVPIILHAVWDMPFYLLNSYYLLYIILIIIAWLFVFSLINAGLKQIVRLNE